MKNDEINKTVGKDYAFNLGFLDDEEIINNIQWCIYIQWGWRTYPMGMAYASNGDGVYTKWDRRIYPMRVAYISNGDGVYIQWGWCILLRSR